MSSHALESLFDIEAPKSIANPPTARKKSVSIRAPTDYELDEIVFGEPLNGPSTPRNPFSGTQTPKTPDELERSEPSSPLENHAAAGLVPTFWNPPMNKWRVLCACLVYFSNGANDAAPGTLIPYMETDYSIGYAIVSLIFVTNAAGFIAAAFCTDAVLGRIGRAKTLMLSELIMLVGYIMLVCTPPFPLVVAAFFFLGYGCAINLALNNVFCSNLAGGTVLLGATHGSYGIGGIFAPILATSMVSRGLSWSRFYFVMLALRVTCVVFNGWAFWNYEKEAPMQLLSALERTATQQSTAETDAPTKKQLLMKAIKDRVTLIGALFIFAYQGAEVSIAGWVISFLIQYRGGDPATVGYVMSGFWGGITLGRFTLTHLAHRVGEKPFVYILSLGAIGFQILVWLVPNVIGDAVAVSILGLLLGPVYPCAQTIFTKLLPRQLQMSAVGFIASAGSSGGAIAPFTTGLLAQAVGTYVLHPVCIGLFVVMLGCWWGLPAVRKRTE